MEIIICDHNQEVINDYIDVFILDGFDEHTKLNESYRIKFKCSTLEECLGTCGPFDAVISAANSLLFMDGGSDRGYTNYYTQRGVNIQQLAQETVKFFGITSALGRSCLPIGSCMLVTPQCANVPLLISAPTMHLPEDVSETKNALYAMYSVLRYLYWYNKHEIGPRINRILLPPMCTGYGKMPAKQSAMQVYTAMLHTFQPKFKKKVPGEYFYPIGYIKNSEPDQPNSYENQREFADINYNLPGSSGSGGGEKHPVPNEEPKKEEGPVSESEEPHIEEVTE